MIVTVILCLLSTTVFCACLRATMSLANARFAPAQISGSHFSVNARRIARNYAMGATIVLAGVAFVGAIHSYIELFQFKL